MIFHWPVGEDAERVEFHKLPGAWTVATRYGERYAATGETAIHTGLDFNLNRDPAGRAHFDLDAHSPVHAAGDGRVAFCGDLPVWGYVIVIEHPDARLWTRYAHVERVMVQPEATVTRGQVIAHVGNAHGRYPYHLHYDMARRDLRAKPSDWPGDDLARVQRDYLDPVAVMRAQHPAARASLPRLRIIASPGLRVRAQPSPHSNIQGQLPHGAIVQPVEQLDQWARIEGPIAGWIARQWTSEVT